ncbi:MAG: methylmalonyl Co-A mutase-associated GTPase MeaB [Sphingomonadales bacterium]
MVAANKLASQITAGNRQALARAITLIESVRDDHRAQARDLLAHLLPDTRRSIRLGISGSPGVGKSTFIEAFGGHLTAHGHKVAVLAVDPSSTRGGGSILADKTRMETLSRDPNAFIRPSPSGRTAGGVARGTRDTIALVEAAGFDVVIVETVGVGQSETAAYDLVDMFILLLNPAGGDELQGIKRGIVELADLMVVTKADGALRSAATKTAAQYGGALGLLRPGKRDWKPEIVLTSAREQRGIEEVWRRIEAFRTSREQSGALVKRRAEQATTWMWRDVETGLIEHLKQDRKAAATARKLARDVAAGTLTPAAAAWEILAAHTSGEGSDRNS